LEDVGEVWVGSGKRSEALPGHPSSWPAWAVLLPHLLALDPAAASTTLRDTACNGIWYY
jgi:hypothetical protein